MIDPEQLCRQASPDPDWRESISCASRSQYLSLDTIDEELELGNVKLPRSNDLLQRPGLMTRPIATQVWRVLSSRK